MHDNNISYSTVSNMRKISYSTDVYASPDIIWRLLLEKAEKPQSYMPGVTEAKILERYDDGFLREIKTQGMVLKEKVTIDEAHREIRYLLLEHPLLSGEVVNRVVPSSVQNPASPQVLTIVVDWGPKDEEAEKIIQINMPAQIQQEVLNLKELAEKLEKAAN